MLKRLFRFFKKKYNGLIFKKNNKHNEIVLKSYYPEKKISIGNFSYGSLNIKAYNTKGNIIIGNYCSIADNVTFLVGGEHNYKRISVFPFQSKIYNQKTEVVPNYDIVIEDDVWIGYDCLIMSNSHIGKGSVIGARSVVVGDVPPYSIYVGNKIIKKRFSDNIIEKIKDVDFSKITHQINDSYSKYCQEELNEQNIKNIIDAFNNIKN